MSESLAASMDHLIQRVDKLHSSPRVACEVLRLLEDEDFRVPQLVKTIESDPGLATSILKLVNSSYYGLKHTVASVQQAVGLLGSRSLRLAVLSFGLVKQLNQDTPAQVCQDFWQRSLGLAAGACQLSEQYPLGCAGDEAYCAGLLADVGMLLLAQAETEDYVALCAAVPHGPALLEAERQRFGFDHAQLGEHLLQRWNLPKALTEAVACHHQPPDDFSGLPLVVACGNLLADALWVPNSPALPHVQRVLADRFRLDLDGFISLAVACRERIKETADLFDVELVSSIDCEALLEHARRRYMSEAMELALDLDSMTSLGRGAL